MGQPKVLVVDNNADWGKMLVGILKDEGYLAHAEQDPAGALRVLREGIFHAALVDVRLLGEEEENEEGVALAKEIRTLYPYTNVILMTAYGSIAQASRATRECGALDYVEKWPPGQVPEDVLSRLKYLVEIAYKRRFVCFNMGSECPHQIAENPKTIFVAMPFQPAQNNLYQYGLLPLERSLECKITRADKKVMNRALICKICQMIQEAGVCIVDLTGWNANVLFELGLMYGRGKQVILIKHSKEKREKADLKGMEFIPYDLDDYDGLQTSLKSILQTMGIHARQAEAITIVLKEKGDDSMGSRNLVDWLVDTLDLLRHNARNVLIERWEKRNLGCAVTPPAFDDQPRTREELYSLLPRESEILAKLRNYHRPDGTTVVVTAQHIQSLKERMATAQQTVDRYSLELSKPLSPTEKITVEHQRDEFQRQVDQALEEFADILAFLLQQ